MYGHEVLMSLQTRATRPYDIASATAQQVMSDNFLKSIMN
jgi:hypothetical protein